MTAGQPRIIERHPRWLALDKPSGWHSVRVANSDGGPDVQSWLAYNEPSQAALHESGLAHRIDVATSGVMVAGRDEESLAWLRAGFGRREGGPVIEKFYAALVAPGIAPTGQFLLHFFSRYKSSHQVSVEEQGIEKERGQCRWRVIRPGVAAATGSAVWFDLVEVELVGPGKRHQIRAGLAHIGHPLANDNIYGGVAAGELEGSLGLHSWRITIEGESAQAPLPPVFGQSAATAGQRER